MKYFIGTGTVEEVTRRDLRVFPLPPDVTSNNEIIIGIYQAPYPHRLRGLLDEIMESHWSHNDTLHPNLIAVIGKGIIIDDPLSRIFVGTAIPQLPKKPADEFCAFAEERATFLARTPIDDDCRFDIEVTYSARQLPQYEELRTRLTPFGLTRAEWTFLRGYPLIPPRVFEKYSKIVE